MSNLSLQLPTGTIIDLNQSRVGVYDDCHRKFYWKFVENLEPDTMQKQLVIGSAIHKGLEMLRKEKLSVEEAVAHAVAYVDSSVGVARLPGDQEVIDEVYDTVNRMLPAYVEFWGAEDMGEPLGIECKGRVEIGTGTGCFLIFRLDELSMWKKQIWIRDYKTAAKLDPRDMMKYEMDLQLTAYIYAANKLWALQGHGMRVSGAIVDVLVKTKVPKFVRDIFTRNVQELQEFEDEWIERAHEIAWRIARVKAGENPKTVFYKNTRECFRFGTCPMRPLCLKDSPTARSLFIVRQEDYVDNQELLK